jgi:hypothetical protein
MHLAKFINSKSGRLFMSAILGFGLATIFRSVCEGKNCVVFVAPPLSEIEDKIFEHNGKCYKYEHATVKCDPSKEIVNVE